MRPDHLTWTALLGKWVQFAQASLALPDDADGERWRRSVPSIITLQAVTFAMAELDRIENDDRLVALDKAEILVRDHVRRLESNWPIEEMPSMVRELCQDAHRALRAAGDRFDPRSDAVDPA